MYLRSVRRNTHWNGIFAAVLIAGLLILLVTACTVRLVQPYDEKLLNDTEAFYKNAATMIEEGKAVSPKTDAQRQAITNPAEHPGHFSAFESRYDVLITDSEALILRGIAGSQEIDAAGQAFQEKIDAVIDASLPSECPELQAEFGKVSLTAKNFVDLKCLILKWRKEHNDVEFTRGKRILKRGNWEGRKRVLFNIILAIQTAESFKKEQ